MEKLKIKASAMQQALNTLKEAITYMEKEHFLGPDKHLTDKKMYRFLRDSIIQRFEYCVDLIWKVLKVYLEEFEKVTLETTSP